MPVVEPDFEDSEQEIYCVKDNFAMISEEYEGHTLRGIELLETLKLRLQIAVETMKDLRSVIDPLGENIVGTNSTIFLAYLAERTRTVIISAQVPLSKPSWDF